MRKSFGLAVVGFALTFGVGSRFASQARVNQPIPATSTFGEQQLLGNDNLLRVTAFPKEEVSVNNSRIEHSSANPFDSSVTSQRTENLSTTKLYAQTTRQEIPETEEVEGLWRVMDDARSHKSHQRPMGEIIQAIAQSFLGTAYKAGLLDQSKEETLVVTLNKFDCVLFVETVLAIARGVAVQDYSSERFVNHIREQRYWDGQMNGYCSRLHYFSEWIYDNEKRGAVKNIGQELGGIPLNKKLNFMSSHRQSYPRLSDDTTYQCIVQREAKLDGVTVDYIPTNQIHRVYPQLQPGDIVAIATNIPGLDVTHTGLVYRHPDGNIGLIHASPIGQVTIAPDLQRYVGKVENAIGILVARPVDPRPKTN